MVVLIWILLGIVVTVGQSLNCFARPVVQSEESGFVLNRGVYDILVDKNDANGASCGSSYPSLAEKVENSIRRYRLKRVGSLSCRNECSPVLRLFCIVRLPFEFLPFRMIRAFVPEQLSGSSAVILDDKVPRSPLSFGGLKFRIQQGTLGSNEGIRADLRGLRANSGSLGAPSCLYH